MVGGDGVVELRKGAGKIMCLKMLLKTVMVYHGSDMVGENHCPVWV